MNTEQPEWIEPEKPEWIELQNKKWTEEDGTNHNVSDYQSFHGCYTYTIISTMPVVNKKFYSSVSLLPNQLTNLNIQKFSKIAKQNLLNLMFEELLNRKLKDE